MKKLPLVSIIINNYNKSIFCLEAINSCLKQNYKKIEIIFFDDGSTDNSLKIVKNFIHKNKVKNIKVLINKKKRGKIFSYNQINAIQTSLKYCKGEYICLLDSDDFFKKEKIKKIISFFKKNIEEKILFDKPIYFPKKKNIFYFKRNIKWPKFPPTSCISLEKNEFSKVLKKINFKKYPNLWLDFRIAVYFSVNRNQFNVSESQLTYYRQNEYNFDNRYKKYLNKNWWKRRAEAFDFLKRINTKIYKKNIFTIDFQVTKLINKFLSI